MKWKFHLYDRREFSNFTMWVAPECRGQSQVDFARVGSEFRVEGEVEAGKQDVFHGQRLFQNSVARVPHFQVMALGGKMVKRVKRGTKKIWHEKIERNKDKTIKKNEVQKKLKKNLKKKKKEAEKSRNEEQKQF